MSSLIVIHFYPYDSFSCVCIIIFPWLRYCAYWGCTSWLISDSFLTHIILHAGRIFQQWCHNCIICLVIESALHVYKGQFSPWLGQFTYYGNSSPVFIGFNSASVKVKSNAQPPDLECQKLSNFWSQSYVNIAYIINFQVQSTPGNIHFKFELHILGLHLSVCWVLGIRKERHASNIRVTNTTRNRSWSSGLLIP